MTREEMNYHVDKAIKDFPEWPEQVKYLLVFTPRKFNSYVLAVTNLLLHEIVYGHPFYRVTTLTGGCSDLVKDHWFKVTPELYNQRKENNNK